MHALAIMGRRQFLRAMPLSDPAGMLGEHEREMISERSKSAADHASLWKTVRQSPAFGKPRRAVVQFYGPLSGQLGSREADGPLDLGVGRNLHHRSD